MRLRTLVIVGLGLGVGYLLGTKSGRARYQQLKTKVTEVWEDPRTQKAVTEGREFVRENAPIVQARVAEAVSTAAAATISGAKTASEKVAETTKDLSGRATDTATTVKGRVLDTAAAVRERGEEARDRAIITASTARDNALEDDPDDDAQDNAEK